MTHDTPSGETTSGERRTVETPYGERQTDEAVRRTADRRGGAGRAADASTVPLVLRGGRSRTRPIDRRGRRDGTLPRGRHDTERRGGRADRRCGDRLPARRGVPERPGPDDPALARLGREPDVERGAFSTELDAGFGVLSFDQRGHGESGGQAHVQEPDREGRDVVAVLDYVADLDWVARSTPAGMPIPKRENPTVFAMGGSYGGGYQLVGAFTETRDEGFTRIDALAPEITWFDLPESLAPAGVPRSTWLTALQAVGAAMVPQYVNEAFAYSLATGEWPDGDSLGEPDLDTRFHDNGSVGFVEDGLRLDVPVLFGQGLSDNLFNLNQAWGNLERALTADARERSAVVGYNGGHALPNAFPPGTVSGTNPPGPTDDFAAARLRFFEHVRDGTGDARDVVGAPYLLATADGSRAIARDRLDDRTELAGGVTLAVEGDGEGGLAVEDQHRSDGGAAASTTGLGAPVHLTLAEGPLTVAGVPTLSARVTTAGVNQRLFCALSTGATPAAAQVVQNNVLPLAEPDSVTGADRTIELPGVAVDVPDGETLYLTLAAISDMFVGHGSIRTPGLVVLEDLAVRAPLVDD